MSINLRNFDLNLLVCFDALMSELNVSKAHWYALFGKKTKRSDKLFPSSSLLKHPIFYFQYWARHLNLHFWINGLKNKMFRENTALPPQLFYPLR